MYLNNYMFSIYVVRFQSAWLHCPSPQWFGLDHCCLIGPPATVVEGQHHAEIVPFGCPCRPMDCRRIYRSTLIGSARVGVWWSVSYYTFSLEPFAGPLGADKAEW